VCCCERRVGPGPELREGVVLGRAGDGARDGEAWWGSLVLADAGREHTRSCSCGRAVQSRVRWRDVHGEPGAGRGGGLLCGAEGACWEAS
jgi:hypothetical protein